MRRRELISLFAGAAAWPIAARAQPQGIRRVGCLMPWPDSDPVARASVTAFADALGHLGWNDDRNIRIDYRFAANEPTLFKTYAAELVGQAPNVIVASTPPAVAAVRQLTGTIPIVFVLMLDPVGSGLVQSLARPGANVTGFGVLEPSIMGKWLQLLKDVAPRITRVAVIFNPETRNAASEEARIVVNNPPKYSGSSRVRHVSRVTTPKLLPPPPLRAQNKSALVQVLAMRAVPSAVTTSASSRFAAAVP